MIWCSTIIPLGISLVLHSILGYHSYIFIVTFILNFLFLLLDYKQAKKVPNLFPSWYWVLWGLIFLPAYLYLRTVKPYRTYKYLIVWLMIYVLDLAMVSIL